MMADLISRDAAIAEIYEYLHGLDSCISEPDLKLDGYKNGLQVAIQELRELPAVDAVPVVHGRWIEYPLCLGYVGAYSEDHIVCSSCKTVWSIIDNDTERFKQCPNCGAKMDG